MKTSVKEQPLIPQRKVSVKLIYCAGLSAGTGPGTTGVYSWQAYDQDGRFVMGTYRGLGAGNWTQKRAARFALNRALTWAAVNNIKGATIFTNCRDTGEEAAGLAGKLSADVRFVENGENRAEALALEVLSQLHKETGVA